MADDQKQPTPEPPEEPKVPMEKWSIEVPYDHSILDRRPVYPDKPDELEKPGQ